MADYFMHFSCLLDVRTPENVTRVLELYGEFAAELTANDEPEIGFVVSPESEPSGAHLWIRDDVTADPEHVIRFVIRCAKAFRLTGRWGFQWADTCSRPRLDAFGGGAHILNLATGRTVAWTDTNDWLARGLTTRRPKRGAS